MKTGVGGIANAGPSDESVIDGRYVLKREIAVGGGSRVYAAEHRYMRRIVALKVPGTEAAQSVQAYPRLRREAEALGMVRHPGIVDVFDAGQVNGVPYLVMELLEGRTLAGLLTSRGKLGIAEVIRIGCEIASALETCHAAGVIHRDIKPSNLFVTLNPTAPVKLLDFGIAKLRRELPGGRAEKLTQDESILGTPEYMAPESLLASPTADERVDVYALGVTLYECLTGGVPFDGRYGEVLLKLSTMAVPSPLEKRPETPPDLASTILKALSREAGDRFATMRELREALEACRAAQSGPGAALLQQQGQARPVTSGPGPQGSTTTQGATQNQPTSAAAAAADNGISRRRFARAPYITPARLVRASGEVLDGRIEEVSEGGLLFLGAKSCESGERVRLKFALPATGRIADVVAEGRWARAARGAHATGFEFMDPSEELRNAMKQYVAIMCPPT